jgi:3-deoxy-manno-octulosonate cytidylyltransferase (CMP-KDO synthetase)
VSTISILIPARMASSRFPGKVLADSTGRPLIQHVWEAAGRAACVKAGARVVVATDDERVRAAVTGFGGEAVMTSPDHPNGTSRLAEAAAKLGLGADATVVNVQGDEPELEPALIDAAVGALNDPAAGAPMATVALPFGPDEDPADPNLVKVVRRLDGTAMYFSRALIPFVRDGGGGGDEHARPLKHVGLYAYRRTFLDTYLSLTPTTLEKTEQLEQLRVLYYGHRIAVAVGASRSFGGIDTPEQYAAFVERWRATARG